MSVLVHDGADEATYTKAVERIMEVFLKSAALTAAESPAAPLPTTMTS